MYVIKHRKFCKSVLWVSEVQLYGRKLDLYLCWGKLIWNSVLIPEICNGVFVLQFIHVDQECTQLISISSAIHGTLSGFYVCQKESLWRFLQKTVLLASTLHWCYVYWAPMMGTRQFDTTNPRISFHFRKGFFLSIRSFYETFKKLLSRKQVSWH